ncbi:hypothetical protein ASR47_10091 [Janthinobacterium psychrotolerans]|uniref:Uncharacterized protein n=1 Tax=Janthinobacterium psychrotolerans TaxID=1747903 RepID=A0A1A7C0B8_9BURK|nr:hypothetical protein ASR47_10091 [Janthinobacterium psychrotolerans]
MAGCEWEYDHPYLNIYPLPLTFKFGDGVKIFAHTCKVKEVVLMTSQGTFTYSFR